MKNLLKKLTAVVICLSIIWSTVYAADIVEIDTSDGTAMSAFFEQLMKVTEKQYRFDITYEQLLESALETVLKEHPEMFAELAKGAYSALDEHSEYLTSDEYTSRLDNTMGQFVGIGVNVSYENGEVILGAPLEGSSAPAAGIKVGDVVTSIDGVDVTGYDINKAVSMIRGEEGTYVTLGIKRNGENMTFKVKRVQINVSPIEYHKLDENNAGYVKITQFNANTSEYLDQALKDLSSKGVNKIILDLRDNPGGLITEAVKVASNFVPDNSLVVTESYKDPKKDIKHYSLSTGKKFKVVVLVNENSASASELVTGAIRDYKVGPTVGVDTYGKGTVQTSVLLKNQDAIWLTIAKYNLPNGENIDKIGIKPDYYVENVIETVDKSKMEPLNVTRALQLGDEGKDVLALKQRLSSLGYYFTDIDEKYDARMADVVAEFQTNQNLFSYGVADLTTQNAIEKESKYAKVTVDRQMDKALELIYNMK